MGRTGRPAGALTKPPVEATTKALKSEAAARFLETFGHRWDPFYVVRLGVIGPTVERAVRRRKREQQLRGALDRLRSAALHAARVVEAEPALTVLDSSNSLTDELAARVIRIVTKLPRDLTAEHAPWAQKRVGSLRARIAKNASGVFNRKLGPRELAFIGILAGVEPTVRKKGKRVDTVQDVLEREANAYARMSQRKAEIT